MKRTIISLFSLLFATIALYAQTINLAGKWDFQIDRKDVGISEKWYAEHKFDDTIELPASMPERLKGDDISVNTRWVGSLYDSSYFYNPYMEKYRKPGKDMKLTFFLTPNKHYVGVAWYKKEINIDKVNPNSSYNIYFERAHIETTLFVNGQRVGMQNSLVAAHQFDVTSYLTNGKNTIVVRIDNRQETVKVGQDSHSITDQTQGDWNGIVGRMELQERPATHITDLQVYPEYTLGVARVKLQIAGKAKQKVKINLLASADTKASKPFTRSANKTITLERDTTMVEVALELGKDFPEWSEFEPNLLTLKATLSGSKMKDDVKTTTFGMRKFEIRGRMFYINNIPIQLRGTVENCCFPLTGYAPMDVESWLKVFKRCREYGLNHMRFHSYCPPEAAFIAADQIGFYLQPEGPSWPNHGVALGNGQPIDKYLMEETQRMARDYGNHPSFCMMACGNEPAGHWVEWVSKFVDYWKATDPRRVYTGASVGGGWAWQPKSQYHVKAGARGLNWASRAPQSMDDFTANISRYGGKDVPGGVDIKEPYISHETGQWCAFPNFEETVKYTGVNKARNFEVFQDILRDNGMETMAKKFLYSAGKLQSICYKYEIERTMRTPDYAGFQLLSLNDYSGQGTALVGVTDVFFDDKGYMTADRFRQFCSEVVPLARIPKFTYTSDETFHAEILVNQFANHTIKNAIPYYTISAADRITFDMEMNGNNGKVQQLDSKQLSARDLPNGTIVNIGDIDVALDGICEPTRLILTVGIKGTDIKNEWSFWVYPAKVEAPEGNVWISDVFDEKTKEVLRKGGKVLLTAAGKISYGKDVSQQFTPVFWNTSWFKMRPPHTTGIYADNTHGILELFPTDYHSDLQWWELVNKAQVMQFTQFPADFQPIVQSIDTWFISRKIGMLFEANVLGGKLVMTTMDITSRLNERVAARQMRASILNYMNSGKFNPKFTLEPQHITDLYEKEAPAVNTFTKESPDELKPKLN